MDLFLLDGNFRLEEIEKLNNFSNLKKTTTQIGPYKKNITREQPLYTETR
jgi:hypothetical protein